MLSRLNNRINAALEPHLPEQRLFLKSDADTRFIRLRPLTQAITIGVASMALGWMIFATALIMLDSISAGSSREQVQRQQALYEERLNALSIDRDLRVEEAASAQMRFNAALGQVSLMQARLLAAEDSWNELQIGIDVIQGTLRRTIKERDQALGAAELAAAELENQTGTARTETGRMRDTEVTLELITAALDDTSKQRDVALGAADRAAMRAEDILRQKRDL